MERLIDTLFGNGSKSIRSEILASLSFRQADEAK
jgi:hypothetical protein